MSLQSAAACHGFTLLFALKNEDCKSIGLSWIISNPKWRKVSYNYLMNSLFVFLKECSHHWYVNKLNFDKRSCLSTWYCDCTAAMFFLKGMDHNLVLRFFSHFSIIMVNTAACILASFTLSWCSRLSLSSHNVCTVSPAPLLHYRVHLIFSLHTGWKLCLEPCSNVASYDVHHLANSAQLLYLSPIQGYQSLNCTALFCTDA